MSFVCCPEGGSWAAGCIQREVAAAQFSGDDADSGVQGGEGHETDPVCSEWFLPYFLISEFFFTCVLPVCVCVCV